MRLLTAETSAYQIQCGNGIRQVTCFASSSNAMFLLFPPKKAWQVLSFKEATVWQDSYLQTPAMLYVMFWPGGPFCGLCFIPEAPLFIFQEMALHSGGGVWV